MARSENDKFTDTLGQRTDNLSSPVDNLASKLAWVKSSLLENKAVNNELLKRAASLERGLHNQE